MAGIPALRPTAKRFSPFLPPLNSRAGDNDITVIQSLFINSISEGEIG